jgi:hypothetical protein
MEKIVLKSGAIILIEEMPITGAINKVGTKPRRIENRYIDSHTFDTDIASKKHPSEDLMVILVQKAHEVVINRAEVMHRKLYQQYEPFFSKLQKYAIDKNSLDDCGVKPTALETLVQPVSKLVDMQMGSGKSFKCIEMPILESAIQLAEVRVMAFFMRNYGLRLPNGSELSRDADTAFEDLCSKLKLSRCTRSLMKKKRDNAVTLTEKFNCINTDSKMANNSVNKAEDIIVANSNDDLPF